MAPRGSSKLVGLPTIKDLRKQAEVIGLERFSHLHKVELAQRISEARDLEMAQWIQRTSQTGRYPTLQSVVDNPKQHRTNLQKIHKEADLITSQEGGERALKPILSPRYVICNRSTGRPITYSVELAFPTPVTLNQN